MEGIAKILIAYDGSACFDAALEDLRWAGLPVVVEAAVVTVADLIFPMAGEEHPNTDVPAIRIAELRRRARARAEEATKQARHFAERAAERVKASFPVWEVRPGVRCGSPA